MSIGYPQDMAWSQRYDTTMSLMFGIEVFGTKERHTWQAYRKDFAASCIFIFRYTGDHTLADVEEDFLLQSLAINKIIFSVMVVLTVLFGPFFMKRLYLRKFAPVLQQRLYA